MKRAALIISILSFTLHSEAKGQKEKAPESSSEFYYSIPAEASSEWAHLVPECPALGKADRAALKNCAAYGNHEMCGSTKTIVLTNALTSEKKKFSLIYHVFKSKQNCTADREALLSGEE